MTEFTPPSSEESTPTIENSSNRLVAAVAILTAGTTIAAVLWFALSGNGKPVGTGATASPVYPIGIVNAAQPSGEAPPGPNALAHYNLAYLNNFTGRTLPADWDVFTGVPGGDAGGQFASSHVVIRGGVLYLNAWKDPAYGGKWVTGGLCQCGLARTYGAYFVRSRQTGPGPNDSELLWPKAPVWPPEIDFNENGGFVNSTSATVHFGPTNHIDQRTLGIDMTQWHTWGVIWGPTSVIYTVDGRVWGKVSVASEIPRQPMTLDMEQRTRCNSGSQCPSKSVSMEIDWVAEYIPI